MFAAVEFGMTLVGWGLGLACAGALAVRLLAGPLDFSRMSALASTALGAGILIDYTLVLLAGSLATSAWLLAGVAVAGAAYLAREAWGRRIPRPGGQGLAFTLGLAALFLLLANQVLIDPLWAWDARSIWFFHAKLIYYAGGLFRDDAWQLSAHAFSHVDYPKLVPVLVARAAQCAGLWNEHAPKAGLLPLLAVALLGLGAAPRRPIGFFFLLLSALAAVHGLLWIGYVDGYLALFAATALLFLARWLARGASGDLAAGLVQLGIVASLKNEGLVLAACILAPAAGAWAWRRKHGAAEPVGRAAAVAALGLAAVSGWLFRRALWQLEGDLQPASLIGRAAERLENGEATLRVAGALLLDPRLTHAAIVLAAVLVALVLLRLRVPRVAALPLVAALAYTAVLFGVYLGTPYDLDWHLVTSAPRTALPLVTAVIASTFLLIDALEGDT